MIDSAHEQSNAELVAAWPYIIDLFIEETKALGGVFWLKSKIQIFNYDLNYVTGKILFVPLSVISIIIHIKILNNH